MNEFVALLETVELDGASDRVGRDLVGALAGPVLSRRLSADLRALREDDQFYSDTWQANQLLLAQTEFASLSLSVASSAPRYALSLERATWICLPSTGGEVHIERYRPIEQDGRRRAELEADILLKPGDAIHFHRGEIVRLCAQSTTVVAALGYGTPANTVLKVDAFDERLSVIEHTQNDAVALCTAAQVLGCFGSERDIDALSVLTRNPSSHVRWAGAAALVQISPEAALPLLEQLSDDKDGEVQRAARITLQRVRSRLAEVTPC